MSGLVAGPDGLLRCAWGATADDYRAYHDDEWGRPLRGDDEMFERMSLEAMQSGLSWITILRKRENFRAAFHGFVIEKVAAFGLDDYERLMADAGIVRNRAKIEAVMHNAKVAAEMGPGLSDLLWSHAPEARPRPVSMDTVPAVTDESKALAKALKKRGFKFIGPTTCYALMQAVGMVDDHVEGCCVELD